MSSHQEGNLVYWTGQAPDYAVRARRNWASTEITWGIWGIPETGLGALPEVLTGLDVVELGCGTAYFSSWLARRGARPTGVDLTPAQLATARTMQLEHDLEFPLVEADAVATGLPSASFDLVISEYGASLWCPPEEWIGEASRLLRPGGRLVFLTNHPLLMVCSPVGTDDPVTRTLERPYFGLGRVDYEVDTSVEFHQPHGERIATLRRHGFAVEALHELAAPATATTHFDWIDAAWASRWPSEELWVCTKG